jgi:GAF domain-containing protein
MNDDHSDLGLADVTRPRERKVSRVFVQLADTLVDDFDVVELLDRLVHAAVDVLGATAAGLLIDDQRGSLALVASSSEQSRLLEIFQLQTDEGPCLDCIRGGHSVVSGDLAADADRWPIFVPAALDAGFRSVVAVPLRLRSVTIGGLNMFHGETEPLTEDDKQLAQALADVATIGILQQRSAHRSSELAEQLQHALNSRVIVEQAKGVFAERNAVDMDTAFASLRQHARDNNLKLGVVALSVIDGDLNPNVVVPTP